MVNKSIIGAACACLAAVSFSVDAALVTGGNLLSGADGDQLETWLSVGNQDFTNIWIGIGGVSTADQFHAAVDDAGPTISIYSVTSPNGAVARVGGYTTTSWDVSGSALQADDDAFIFNLDAGEIQRLEPKYVGSFFATERRSYWFSVFGPDLRGGSGILGVNAGAYSDVYDRSQGLITQDGDTGYGIGSIETVHGLVVHSLEVYTFAPSTVPIPSAVWLFGSGLIGLIGLARRKKA